MDIDFLDVSDLYGIDYFPMVLFTDVYVILPGTTAKEKNPCKAWFNAECKDAMKTRKSALASFRTNIT